MTLTLAMIVRDEEASIGRLIRSCKHLIDRAVIVDTGSVDQTETRAREALDGTETHWYDRPWMNMARNRTELVEIAAGHTADGGYLLCLDADDEVIEEAPLPDLTADAYNIRYLGSTEWYLPRIIRTGLPWRYEGVTHSYLKCGHPIRQERLDVISLRHHAGEKTRAAKFERDVAVLEQAVSDNPADSRSWFYLAQSYRDLGRVDDAVAAYRRRAELGGWAEEHYFALYQAGALLCKHRSFAAGAPLLIAAWKLRPSRAEALRALSRSAAGVADKIPYPSGDVLFVRSDAYKTPAPSKWDEWRATYGTRTVQEEQAFYEDVFVEHRDQSRYDASALRRMLDLVPSGAAVIELGGWDGALAAEILFGNDRLSGWTNHEISVDAVAVSVCDDPRYEAVTDDDWYWNLPHTADVFVASHVIEHLSLNHLRATFDATDATWLFLQAPLEDGPTDWAGYQGTHMLEVGWDGIHEDLERRGYVRLDDLSGPHVRCYRRAA